MLYGSVKNSKCQKGHGFIVSEHSEKEILIHGAQLENIGLNIITTDRKIAYGPYNDRGRIVVGNLHII